jgi:hypothetical protein
LKRKASQKEIKVEDVKEAKDKPKRKRKIKTSPLPEPPQGNDAFSRAASETERKGKKQKGRAGWLARWFP